MKSVLIPLAPGFEDLEAVTLSDLLRRAGIEVVTAGLQAGLIQGARGLKVQPDATLDEVLRRDFDMIALPGGMPGAEHLKNDARVQTLLRHMGRAGKYTVAICAAPIALAQAGLLEGKRATSYPGFVDKMDLPTTQCVDDPVVVDGKVATSRGPGTAMDFALILIELLLDKAKRDQVEAGLVRPLNPIPSQESAMFIREVLSIKGDCANFATRPDALLAEAVSLMVANDIGSLLVLHEGALVGFITERDILRGMHQRGCSLCDVTVSEFMEKEPVVATLDDSVDYARDAMTKSRISHLIVLDGSQVAGVISFHDVARACLKEAHFENALLKRYIKHWPE